MYMYFTQEKTNLRDCTLSWHWLHCLCIRLHTGGLSDITNWWYYFNFYYVQNLLPLIQCVPLFWIEWSESLYCCGFGMLSIVLLVKNSSKFSGCYHESVLGPSVAQLISASRIKTAPSCTRELVNEWCNVNWLWRLNCVTLLRHHHNKHWITERKQNYRESVTSYVGVINVCTNVCRVT